ncbi:MAG: ABC transporter ATP-binding protein [Dysgonamonadaceae bacterium]|jgi:zinc transport system ATP-binding protein|nr:ABC transporter ATP-binding protein [Dysgonamonadaceae bacterium]
MNKPVVEIKNLNVAYNGNIVLKDACLTVYEQDFLGIIGPNGGGKTTLVKAILGLLKPVSGEIRFADENLKNRIGYMPQNNQIDRKFPILVAEAVDSGLIRNKNENRASRREKIYKMLSNMGIEDLALKPIGELSGGQLQRVLLARALVNEPELLILDEPNSYVDKFFESYFYNELQEINRTTAIILVSHDIGTIVSTVKNIACVNETLHYHSGADVSGHWLEEHLGCPLDVIAHGDLPHRVLKKHDS